MAKLDYVIQAKVDAGWHLNEAGQLCRPDGTPHVKHSNPKPQKPYYTINFGIDGRIHEVRQARIVCWLAHGAPPSSRHQVDHIDRNPLNDHPDNLRWATPSENTKNVSPEEQARREQVLHDLNRRRLLQGADSVKLSFDIAAEIRHRWEAEDVSIVTLAREYDVCEKTIADIVHGRSWKQTTLLSLTEVPPAQDYTKAA